MIGQALGCMHLLELAERGLPLCWRTHFEVPPEGPSLYFLGFRMEGVEAWEPPPVGASERLGLALHHLTAPGEPIPKEEGLH